VPIQRRILAVAGPPSEVLLELQRIRRSLCALIAAPITRRPRGNMLWGPCDVQEKNRLPLRFLKAMSGAHRRGRPRGHVRLAVALPRDERRVHQERQTRGELVLPLDRPAANSRTSYTSFSLVLALIQSSAATTMAMANVATPACRYCRRSIHCLRTWPMPPPPTKPMMVDMRTLMSHR
jgi:hypothetical protein